MSLSGLNKLKTTKLPTSFANNIENENCYNIPNSLAILPLE